MKTYTIGERGCFSAALAQAVAKRHLSSVRRLLRCAEDRIIEAELIGWEALAQSWRPQLAEAEAALKSLGKRA